MMKRRTMLASSSAAVAAAATSATAAADTALVDVKMDPWNQPPELLKSRYLRFPRQDDEARQDFTRGMSRFVSRQGSHPDTVAHQAAFLQAKGHDVTADTDLTPEQCFQLMLQDPAYAARFRLQRSNFHLHWDNPKRAFYRDYNAYMAEMEAADTSGPGSLELNPNMAIPEYTSYEVHTQPGGYVGEPFAGWIYDYGHVAGTDDLRDHGRSVAYAQSLRLPADGKVKRILDLGCGMGATTMAIKERFPNVEVWGIDVGAPMVRYSHYRAVKRNMDVHFAQRLAEDTRFPDGHFDIVADCIMFHEVSAQAARKIVAEAKRILRPGGVFNHVDVVTAGHAKYQAPRTILAKASSHTNHRENIEPWWVQYETTDFPKMVASVGLQVDLTGAGVGNTKSAVGTYPAFAAFKAA